MFEISRRSALKIAAFAAATSSMRPALAGSAILPSWVDGNAKARIMDFVTATTTEGSADFVEPAARVAVFDNDGTLWGEQPTYVQLAFALDRVKQLAPQHPE